MDLILILLLIYSSSSSVMTTTPHVQLLVAVSCDQFIRKCLLLEDCELLLSVNCSEDCSSPMMRQITFTKSEKEKCEKHLNKPDFFLLQAIPLTDILRDLVGYIFLKFLPGRNNILDIQIPKDELIVVFPNPNISTVSSHSRQEIGQWRNISEINSVKLALECEKNYIGPNCSHQCESNSKKKCLSNGICHCVDVLSLATPINLVDVLFGIALFILLAFILIVCYFAFVRKRKLQNMKDSDSIIDPVSYDGPETYDQIEYDAISLYSMFENENGLILNESETLSTYCTESLPEPPPRTPIRNPEELLLCESTDV